MRAILVSVDYADMLAVTLPYNRHHFEEVMVVTVPGDPSIGIAEENQCGVYATEVFYARGADFNKWAALEEGLDVFGRRGWMVIMDADILWPKQICVRESILQVGYLYGPLARFWDSARLPIPGEDAWRVFPLRPNQTEWAGYTQVFHASDPHLPSPPWHQTDWRHAGGADSYFHMLWPPNQKVRLPFEVLHLGPHGCNWCGRQTPYLDGSRGPGVEGARKRMKRLYAERHRLRGRGYAHERLPADGGGDR